MRLLHTADRHVGRTIRGRSRIHEHVAVLAEIARVADAERCDLVLVAGDVFDSAAPAPDAERIAYRALLDLAEVAPVVVVAGNHDSSGRLGAVAPLLAASRVTVAADVRAPDAGGVLDVAGARIALLPFLSQRGIIRADELMATRADEHDQRYAARLGHLVDALTAGFALDRVNVVLAHLTVVGGTLGGGERAAHTVFEYAIPATLFPASASYVALGHLHRPQQVPGPAPAWYAGSPLQLDFGEVDDDSAVLVIDAAPGTPARVRAVPLTAGRRLRTVRGTLEELEEQAGVTGTAHLRVVVVGQAVAGLAEQVRGWFPDAVDVVVEAPEGTGGTAAAPRPARLGRSARELFDEYLAERGASDARVAELFGELLDEAGAPLAAG